MVNAPGAMAELRRGVFSSGQGIPAGPRDWTRPTWTLVRGSGQIHQRHSRTRGHLPAAPPWRGSCVVPDCHGPGGTTVDGNARSLAARVEGSVAAVSARVVLRRP